VLIQHKLYNTNSVYNTNSIARKHSVASGKLLFTRSRDQDKMKNVSMASLQNYA